MILRPYGVVLDGELEVGLELVLDGPRIAEVRPHTGIPEPFVVSPAFVNAHSHLEYRGLQGLIHETEYWPWIRELTRLKTTQSDEQIQRDCRLAADENRRTGVAVIAEHSDRPFAGEAMAAARLGGVILQEVITFFEQECREEKLAAVEDNAGRNAAVFDGPVLRALHAYYTVDRQTLRAFGQSGNLTSLHVAETDFENDFTREGTGPIATFYAQHGIEFQPTGKSVLASLADLDLVRKGVQLVHCCALNEQDIAVLASSGACVAHCPRSNQCLNCPPAPVRELLDAGVLVGLGLDSAASSGRVDMFAEMRAALDTSESRGQIVSPGEVWRMATSMGAQSLERFIGQLRWEIAPGSETPLIKIHIADAHRVEDLIERAGPTLVEWV